MLKFNNKVPTDIKIGNKTVEKILMRNEVVWSRVQEYFYIENTYNGTNTVSVKQTLSGSPDSNTYAKHLQYSKDGLNWTTITLSSTAYTISLAKNEKVYFRGNEGVFNYWTSGGSQKAITTISASQNHTVGGNINTLLDYTNPNGVTLPQGAFNSMFENDTHLTSASDLTLPSSLDGSLPTYAYLYMFKGCSSLISAPQSIPAKVQGQDACNGMFANCTSLTEAPQLLATTLAAGCYWSLFEGCTSLTVAPALPATTMTSSCYRNLFCGCSSLVTPPALPATTLANYCYVQIFKDCVSLTSAPVLPATTLKPNCYQSAFQGCTSLTVAPALPATTLANYCYQALFRGCSSLTTVPSVIPATTAPYMSCQRMFSDCVSLKSAPELPATTVESGSYQYMFYNCKELTQPPTELPATTLTLNSYYSMFELCSKLTTPPVIKATTFAENSCTAMFRSCASLNNITVCANNKSATDCTKQWLKNVAATGTFYNYGTATYTIDSDSGIPVGWTERKPSLKNEYFFVENLDDGTNSIDGTNILTLKTTVNSGISTKTIEYSKDKISWTTLNLSSTTPTTITMNVGDKIYFRNTSGTWNTIGNHTNLHCSEDFSVGGNIKSLIDYRVDNLQTLPIDSFRDFLSSNSHLIYSHNLFLTSITSQSCYESLFGGCKNLITAPELPATTLSKSCYYGLFLGCSSLISIPNLPATTLAENSYESMFSNCKSLTSVNIQAKTLAKCSCQLMFQGCTGLKNATLQATTIVNESCINMFMNCSSLNSITTYLSDVSPYNCLKDWLKGVAATGTLHNLGNASYTKNSTSGIPSGWTEVKS